MNGGGDIPADYLDRVAEACRQDPSVLLAYVYGSRAAGLARPDSDLDVAVLLSEPIRYSSDWDLDGATQFALRLQRRLSGVEVDVRTLNGAPILFRYQVLRTGRRVYARDPAVREDFEAAAFTEYGDYKYYFDRHMELQRRKLLSTDGQQP